MGKDSNEELSCWNRLVGIRPCICDVSEDTRWMTSTSDSICPEISNPCHSTQNDLFNMPMNAAFAFCALRRRVSCRALRSVAAGRDLELRLWGSRRAMQVLPITAIGGMLGHSVASRHPVSKIALVFPYGPFNRFYVCLTTP